MIYDWTLAVIERRFCFSRFFFFFISRQFHAFTAVRFAFTGTREDLRVERRNAVETGPKLDQLGAANIESFYDEIVASTHTHTHTKNTIRY